MGPNKELLLGVVDYFIKNPFAEKYQQVSQRGWALFLQANFPDPDTGQWLDINDFHFFTKVKPLMEGVAENQIQPNMPANLSSLVEAMKKEKALKAEWEIKRHQHLIEKDIQPQIDILQKRIAQDTLEKEALIQDLNFLISLKAFTERRKNYLQVKNKGLAVDEKQSFQESITQADTQVTEYVQRVFDATKLADRLGLSQDQLRGLTIETAQFIIQRTFNAQNPRFFGQPEEQLSQSIKEVLADAFDYYVRRPANPTNLAAVRNAIPFLRTKRALASQQIAAEIKASFVLAAPTPMISAIKTAMLTNYAVSEEAIEAGNPLGRLPSYITWSLAKNFTAEQILQRPAKEFPQILQDHYERNLGTTKKLSISQETAIAKYIEFLQRFGKANPQAFKTFLWHQKHLIGINWGKAVSGYFIRYPDYLLHFPFIFGKYWLRNKWSLQWEFEWKPKVYGAIINNVPVLGNVLGFWYKKSEWGFYEGPIARFKSKVLERVLQKTLRGAGSLLYKIGRRFGQSKLGQAMSSWATKLFGLASTGGLGALFFAFWPMFKRTIKWLTGIFGLGAIAIFGWLAQYGLPALVGGGVGALVGLPAGGYVAYLTFQATLPFLGPFAIIPAFLAGGITWLASIGFFGALGVFISKIGSWLGLSGQAALGAAESALSGLTTVNVAAAANLVPLALGSIAGLSAFTLMVTHSAFIAPSELAPLLGSRYIEIRKVVDVGGISNPNNVQNSVVGRPLVYGIEVSFKEQPLTDIEIVDVTTATGDWGGGLATQPLPGLPEQKWSLDQAAPDTTWQPIPFGLQEIPQRLQDTLIANTVTVTATGPDGQEEKQTLTLSFSIGQPPLPLIAQLASSLVTTLTSCYGSHVNVNTFNDQGQCLLDQGISQEAVKEIIGSVNNIKALQCVGFARAAAAGSGYPLTGFSGNAKDYSHDAAGYVWYPAGEIKNIRPGDIFIITRGAWGHMGVVVSPSGGNGFLLAEAWGLDANGKPEGYVRTLNYGFDFLINNYGSEFGFLRHDYMIRHD